MEINISRTTEQSECRTTSRFALAKECMNTQAFFILDKTKLKKQYEKIKEQVNKVSYSFKTNPIAGNILEEETKCLFSVHSFHLLKQIKDKSRVLFFAHG